MRRTRAPEGSRPEPRYGQGNRLKLNLISAVSPDGALYFGIHEEGVDGMRVIRFPEQLLEEIDGRLTVGWDNGRIPRSVEVKTLLWEHRDRLETRRFPPYAPSRTRTSRCGPCSSTSDRRIGVRRRRRRFGPGSSGSCGGFGGAPERVASFIRHSELPLPPLP